MHWDPTTSRLLGVVGVGANLQLHSLDPTGKGTWEAAKNLSNVPPKWDTIGGNGGTASAFSADMRSMYVMMGASDPQGDAKFDLAVVDVDKAAITAHPHFSYEGGIAGCLDCLLGIAL